MLDIQNFILNNKNWDEMLAAAPYFLRIKRKNNLIMFNYTQGISQSCEIVNESRGLILEDKTFKVVRYMFYRFYNYGQPGAAQINWNSISVDEKIDGSLVCLYYYSGWHISTRNTFDAIDSADIGVNFDKEVKLAMKNDLINFEDLDKNINYVFELVSPNTKIVIYYPENHLYFLMARDLRNLKEISINNDNFLRPRHYELKTLSDIQVYVNSFPGNQFEGIVVKDSQNSRVKIKNLDFLKFHYYRNNGKIKNEKILELILSGEDSEYLTYFPEHKERFKSIENFYDTILSLTAQVDNHYIRDKISNKDFAAKISLYPKRIQFILFKAYNSSLLDIFQSSKGKSIIITIFNKGEQQLCKNALEFFLNF